MSALPPKADIETQSRDVRFVPEADITRCSRMVTYSIISSPRAIKECGTLRPSAFAVLSLMATSIFVSCWYARAGTCPPKSAIVRAYFFDATVQQIRMGPLLKGQPGAKL